MMLSSSSSSSSSRRKVLLILLLCLALDASSSNISSSSLCTAFQVPNRARDTRLTSSTNTPVYHHQSAILFPHPGRSNSITTTSRNVQLIEDDEHFNELRNEIEEMKRVAREKLEKLEQSSSLTSSSAAASSGSRNSIITNREQSQLEIGNEKNESQKTASSTTTALLNKPELPNTISTPVVDETNRGENDDGMFQEKIAVSNKVSTSSLSSFESNPAKNELNLLDETNWKVSLNIGREPGTWMPKDWGVSGERLVLNLDLNFSPQQLYEREEFLDRMGGAKILKVNKLTMAPTLTQGIRNLEVVNGGWRVCQGAGPMNTDLLRFYFEIEDTLIRTGSDVTCPKGRIYCSCGYFPSNRQTNGYKEGIKIQLDKMILRAEALDEEILAEGPFSLNRFKKSAELFRLKVDMQATGEKLMAATVMEPNCSLLKKTPDKSVGLTKEGGVCCKVPKGIAIEYHILGKFNIASADSNR